MNTKTFNIPNILTMFRLVLVPVVVLLLVNRKPLLGFIFFLVACLTDVLDGYIARHYHLITKLGTWLDPLADKLMSVAVIVTFTAVGILPVFVIVIVAAKELAMLIGGFILLRRDIVIPSNKYGKIATLLLNISIVFSFFHMYVAPYHLYIIYVALVLVIIAFIQYAVIAVRKYAESKK